MPGKTPEAERLPTSRPQKVVTDRSVVEVINPGVGTRVRIEFSKSGAVGTQMGSLTEGERERLQAEKNFTEVVRNFLEASRQYKSAELIGRGGSEQIDVVPDLSAFDFQKQFIQAIQEMARLGFKNTRLKELIEEGGRLFPLGAKSAGEMSPIMKEIVFSLNQTVDDIYLEKARQIREKTHPPRQTLVRQNRKR